jgi:flagellar capping protein FliD
VEYTVNGVTVKPDTRTVTLAPHLTAELLRADATKDITVTTSQGTTNFQAAISSFVDAYNATLDEIAKYTAKGGVLAGNSIVQTLTSQMAQAVTSVTGSSSLNSMAKIGLEFNKDGRLALNVVLLNAEAKDKFSELRSLIGTTKTAGFAKIATDALKALADGNGGGILSGTVTALDASLKAEDERIAAEQSRVEQFTKDLQERLAKADALIAALEQQANYFNTMFEAMRANQKSM